MTYRAALNNFAQWSLVLAFLALVVVASVPMGAQVTGATISGTVKDSSGAVVPNANISVKNSATGTSRQTISDSAGLYSIPNLAPGNYDITISVPGFSTL